MDYILANEKDNFSVDVYFTKSPTPDCFPGSIPAARESAIWPGPNRMKPITG